MLLCSKASEFDMKSVAAQFMTDFSNYFLFVHSWPRHGALNEMKPCDFSFVI